MDSALRIFQIHELWGNLDEEGKRERNEYGPITYSCPSSTEFTIFQPEEIPRLRAYIRSSVYPHQVLQKAAEKGFPLYFQTFRKPFTNGGIYGILNKQLEKEVNEVKTIYCSAYNQRIDPVLCLSRAIIYPQERPPSEYYIELQEKYKAATGRDRKRIRKELKKYDPVIDPYPECRRCRIMKTLVEKTCLGAEYDPEDKECQNCPDKIKCCQVMRLRIESILSGNGKEVAEEVLQNWEKLNKNRKEKKKMARKKKKMEDVTEEVVETIEEPENKKRGRRRKRKAEPEEEPKKDKVGKSRGKKKKEKAPVKDTGKKLSKKAQAAKIKELLAKLDEAKEEGDQIQARIIRKNLRELGYKLSEHKKKK